MRMYGEIYHKVFLQKHKFNKCELINVCGDVLYQFKDTGVKYIFRCDGAYITSSIGALNKINITGKYMRLYTKNLDSSYIIDEIMCKYFKKQYKNLLGM